MYNQTITNKEEVCEAFFCRHDLLIMSRYLLCAGVCDHSLLQLPMNEEATYLSQEKFDELTAELTELKTNKRKEIAEKLEYAKSLGDLSENAEYQEAREAQAAIEDRIATLEALLKSAEIVSSTKKGGEIAIGSVVTLKKKGAKEEQNYEIVGSEEADVAQKKISNKSPLGEVMIGKKKGDTFTFQSPGGEVTYTVVEVK